MNEETTALKQELSSGDAGTSSLFRSTEEAVRVLSKALPNLRCPICANDTFDLLGDIDQNLISKTLVFPREFTVTAKWYPTVGLACQNCGHILNFSTFRLRQLSSRNSPEDENV